MTWMHKHTDKETADHYHICRSPGIVTLGLALTKLPRITTQNYFFLEFITFSFFLGGGGRFLSKLEVNLMHIFLDRNQPVKRVTTEKRRRFFKEIHQFHTFYPKMGYLQFLVSLPYRYYIPNWPKKHSKKVSSYNDKVPSYNNKVSSYNKQIIII